MSKIKAFVENFLIGKKMKSSQHSKQNYPKLIKAHVMNDSHDIEAGLRNLSHL